MSFDAAKYSHELHMQCHCEGHHGHNTETDSYETEWPQTCHSQKGVVHISQYKGD